MKKILISTLVFILIFSVCISVWSWSWRKKKAKTVTLRLAETHPADYPTTKGDYEFAKLVKERTNGRVSIEVYHSKQLGEEKAVIEQVQLGAIDFTRVSVSVTSSFVPILDALQLPYLYRDADHMWNVLLGNIGDEILDNCEQANLIGIGWFDGGTRNFYTKKQVKTVSDLKGMKIRVQQSDLMVKMVNALGAVATPMPFGEVYSALQTGIIDGAENNWPSYDSTSHFEVAKYFIVDAHTRVPEITVGSKIALEKKLSKKEIEICKQAMRDALALQKKLWAEKEKVSEKKVRDAGCIITEPSSAEVQKFMDAMKPLYDEQPANIKALVKKIQNL